MTFLEDVADEDVPDGDDMADAACEDTEMKYGVHVFLFVKRIEHGTSDIEDSLEHYPHKGIDRHRVE